MAEPYPHTIGISGMSEAGRHIGVPASFGNEERQGSRHE